MSHRQNSKSRIAMISDYDLLHPHPCLPSTILGLNHRVNSCVWQAGGCYNQMLLKILENSGEYSNGEVIFHMANQKNEAAIRGIRKYVRHLAVQIHNLQYILDPERLAIGGGISAQPKFLEMLREEVKAINLIFPWKLPIPEIVACEFFNDANLIGAVYTHLKKSGNIR